MMKQTSSTYRRPDWLSNRTLAILSVVFLLIVVAAVFTRPAPSAQASDSISAPVTTFLQETPAPESTPIQPSRTPYPPELLANRRQTIGISLVAALLVLIVAGGVFSVFLRERKSS